jgi:hypothetical protein
VLQPRSFVAALRKMLVLLLRATRCVCRSWPEHSTRTSFGLLTHAFPRKLKRPAKRCTRIDKRRVAIHGLIEPIANNSNQVWEESRAQNRDSVFVCRLRKPRKNELNSTAKCRVSDISSASQAKALSAYRQKRSIPNEPRILKLVLRTRRVNAKGDRQSGQSTLINLTKELKHARGIGRYNLGQEVEPMREA